MSADNGIYILETDGPEFRVAHLQSVEDYRWDNIINDYTDDFDVHIENARSMWNGCHVFTDEDEVVRYAMELASKYDFLEYSVCGIVIPRRF